jgi:hypothetical protein
MTTSDTNTVLEVAPQGKLNSSQTYKYPCWTQHLTLESTLNLKLDTSWNYFVREFTKQFASEQQVDAWWEELDCLRQGENQSVDQIKFRCVELFGVLGLTASGTKVRHYLRAIKPPIARRVAELGHSPSDWDAVTTSAKRIETSIKKYGASGSSEVISKSTEVYPNMTITRNVRVAAPECQEDQVNTNSNRRTVVLDTHLDTERNAPRDDDSVVSLNSLSTVMKELCEGVRDLRLTVNTRLNSGSSSDSGSRHNK